MFTVFKFNKKSSHLETNYLKLTLMVRQKYIQYYNRINIDKGGSK